MRESVAERAQYRIAALVLGNRNQSRIGFTDRLVEFGRRRPTVEHHRLQTPGELCIQQRGALGAAHAADDAFKATTKQCEIMLG
jgi:hypothetical protein